LINGQVKELVVVIFYMSAVLILRLAIRFSNRTSCRNEVPYGLASLPFANGRSQNLSITIIGG
jgi:hypothetical protein